jgi:hypothetical protein
MSSRCSSSRVRSTGRGARKEGAVSFHSPELAIVEALITESPGEHDVIHPLSSAYEGAPREPGKAKSVDIFSRSSDSDHATS